MANDALETVWPEWKIEKQLGRGSYGVVYKAVRRDHNVKSCAAIKVISIPSDAAEVDSLRSEGLDLNATRTYLQGIVDDFVGEIQLMESLKGIQNIVSVEDYKVIERTESLGWDIYIRMELLTPFNSYICDKKLTEDEVIKLGCDICTALEICGQRNIIHRDIKPENIFINDFGYFKLGDFGIARKLENVSGGLSQKGTFNYMAPEIANSSTYDARVDLYSLGIVLYRLLNGNRLPFLDTEKQLLNPNERRNAVERRIRGEALPAPCEASPAMAQVILRACAFDPNQRFASATEMKQALESVRNGTYQADDSDKTVSVRAATAADPNKTVAVHKTAAPLSPQGGQDIVTFGKDSKKKSKAKAAKPEKAPKPEKAAEPGKKKSALPKVAAILVVIVILAGAAIFGVPKLLNGGDTADDAKNSGSSSVTKDRSYTEDENDRIAEIVAAAEEYAAEGNYENALKKVEAGLEKYPESTSLSGKADEYAAVLAQQAKDAVLAQADALAQEGDYVSAMAVIEEAQGSDGSDADYQRAYDSYHETYAAQIRDEAVAAAAALAQQEDYLGALRTVEQANTQAGGDKQLTVEAQAYEDAYVSQVLAQASAYTDAKDYDAAEKVLNTAVRELPDNERLKAEQAQLSSIKPRYLLTECPPYESSRFNGPVSFSMAGETYANGFTLGAGYSSTYALFNLAGKYATLEFDLGHVDGSSMTDAAFEIYLNGEVTQIIEVKAQDLPRHITIALNGAKQMKIKCAKDLNSSPSYGFANVIVTPDPAYTEEEVQLTSNIFLLMACPPYESSRFNGPVSFSMAGETYANGFTLGAGYSSTYALFNLAGEYEGLEFDLGHVDGSSMTDAAFEIYLDGEVAQIIEVKAENLPSHIVVPLNGARQLKIKCAKDLNSSPSYGFANAVLY